MCALVYNFPLSLRHRQGGRQKHGSGFSDTLSWFLQPLSVARPFLPVRLLFHFLAQPTHFSCNVPPFWADSQAAWERYFLHWRDIQQQAFAGIRSF